MKILLKRWKKGELNFKKGASKESSLGGSSKKGYSAIKNSQRRISYRVIFHPEAEFEYSEDFIWYELKLGGLGNRCHDKVKSTIERIRKNPSSS